MAQAITKLLYITARELLSRMTESTLIEVTTEGELSQVVDSGVLNEAIDLIDGVDIEEPSQEAVLVAGVIKNAITWAEGRVNSRIGVVYGIPALSTDGTVPSEIRDAVLTIAEHRLRSRRPRMPQTVQEAYDETTQWLDQVARGRAVVTQLNQTGTTEERRETAAFGVADRSSSMFNKWVP